jgi:hypothetical protein
MHILSDGDHFLEELLQMLVLTLLVPPDFGGASKKCQGEF